MHKNECLPVGRTLVLILGPCAAGKTTLTRVLCGEDFLEQTAEVDCYDRRNLTCITESVKFVVGRGIAIAGNWQTTSDSISKPEALKKVVEICFGLARTVIVDSFRPSNKFVDWMSQHPLPGLRAVFVHLDLTLETNIARLLGRRAANGRIETRLPEKTFNTLLRTRERAEAVWQYAQQNYLREPKTFVTIPDQFTPEQSADLIRKEIELLT
jgi:GTPase SAR1 family protein